MKQLFYNIIIVASFFCCKEQDSKNYLLLKEQTISKIPIDNDTLSIEELMSNKGLKGLSVAVFEDYKIIWSDVWGVRYDSIPLDINTAFSTASISKPITATLFAILEDKGLIDLKIPVNNYLRRWQIPENEFTQEIDVTLEHLLSHTAGTTQGGFTDFYEGDTIPSILESVQGKIPNNDEIEISFKSGTNWRYSGGGYTVAMMALEDHLGESIENLAQKYIFTPLKLKNTSMVQPKMNLIFTPMKLRDTIIDSLFVVGKSSNLAKAHDRHGNIIRTGIPITPQISASGLWSTPTDMATILIEIQKALNGIGSEVISENVAKRITDIVTIKGIRGWSLGWERMHWFRNLDWFSHGGANTGIGGHVYATMKNGNGIVLFGNGSNRVRIPVTDALRDNIIRTHKWGSQLPWANKEELPQTLITKITGSYKDINFGHILEIKEMDGKLYFPVFMGGVKNDLIYVGDNTFIINEVSGKFKFIIDNEGTTKIQFSRDGTKASPFIMFEKVIQ